MKFDDLIFEIENQRILDNLSVEFENFIIKCLRLKIGWFNLWGWKLENIEWFKHLDWKLLKLLDWNLVNIGWFKLWGFKLENSGWFNLLWFNLWVWKLENKLCDLITEVENLENIMWFKPWDWKVDEFCVVDENAMSLKFMIPSVHNLPVTAWHMSNVQFVIYITVHMLAPTTDCWIFEM